MIYKFGLVGEKLAHSFSKEIHENLMAEMSIEGNYELIQIPRYKFDDTFPKLLENKYDGLNVTIPYKELVLPYLDVISETAKKIGAINTISFSKGKTYGYNTDYDGFLEIFTSKNIVIFGKTAAILGYGGAAKAIVSALIDKGISKFVIVVRDKALYSKFASINFINYNEFAIQSIYYDFIINCTPVGMFPNVQNSPIAKNSIRSSYLFDLIYNPTETLLLSYARELGIKSFNGLEMLYSQARKAEEIWQNDKKQE